MILRICDNGDERVEPASVERVERVLAPEASLADGIEVTVADGERWLTALVVGAPGSRAELLLSGADGEAATVSGPATRADAIRLFREFMVPSGSRR